MSSVASSPLGGGGGGRTPVVVMPRSRGDHIVNQQTLWPDRAAKDVPPGGVSRQKSLPSLQPLQGRHGATSSATELASPSGVSAAGVGGRKSPSGPHSPTTTTGAGTGSGSNKLSKRGNAGASASGQRAGGPSFAAAASTVVSPFAKSFGVSGASAGAGVLPGSKGTGGSGHISARTGAEVIVELNTGSLGHGIVVGSDENVHHDARHKRPVLLLPPCCEGALGLKIPELIRGRVANVTLPSRLALLGRQSYETLAALNPINLGNSVLGFAPVWGRQERNGPVVANQLVVLPWIFSTNGARITFFLRILALLVFLVFFFQFIQIYDLNIGRAWLFGSTIALIVMWRLALIRRAPDGIMAFCRSMGKPRGEGCRWAWDEALGEGSREVWRTEF